MILVGLIRFPEKLMVISHIFFKDYYGAGKKPAQNEFGNFCVLYFLNHLKLLNALVDVSRHDENYG